MLCTSWTHFQFEHFLDTLPIRALSYEGFTASRGESNNERLQTSVENGWQRAGVRVHPERLLRLRQPLLELALRRLQLPRALLRVRQLLLQLQHLYARMEVLYIVLEDTDALSQANMEQQSTHHRQWSLSLLPPSPCQSDEHTACTLTLRCPSAPALCPSSAEAKRACALKTSYLPTHQPCRLQPAPERHCLSTSHGLPLLDLELYDPE